MPGGDGTGPFGTFRNCVPAGSGNAGAGFGRGAMQGARRGAGFGAGYGRGGMGRRFMRRFNYDFAEPAESGQSEIEALKKELSDVKKKIDELRK